MRGRGVHNYFWESVSLALLAVLVGLLILMLTEDVQKALERRRH
jgi:hypothetical protein